MVVWVCSVSLMLSAVEAVATASVVTMTFLMAVGLAIGHAVAGLWHRVDGYAVAAVAAVLCL